MINIVGDFYSAEHDINVLLGPKSDSILIINLEAPITVSLDTISENKICLKQDIKGVSSLTEHYNVIANLANNHILDYGRNGAVDTLEALKEINVPTVGLKGNDLFNSISFGGAEYYLLSYVCKSSNPIPSHKDIELKEYSFDNVLNDMTYIRKERGENSPIIIMIHGGLEEVSLPEPKRVHDFRKLTSLKPFAIIGHHSHTIQPFEVYNGIPIFYSLGNFFFPDFSYKHPNGKLSWGVQRFWNNKSLMVSIDHKQKIHVEKLVSCENSVELTGSTITNSWLFKVVASSKSYPFIFNVFYKFGMFRHAISRFIAKPKRPTISALRHIFLGK